MQPLADLLRPTTLDNYIGQSHLVGPKAPLRLVIESGSIHSMILWGPPGCGKTTLAKIIASSVGADFHYLSAVSAKKEDIRKIVEGVNTLRVGPLKKILFLDEIHRFNKSQQDFLLPYVEDGTITLIGATTENPSFEVIGPLQSRCHVYVLKGLTEEDLAQVINQGAKTLKVKIDKDAVVFLSTFANGDGRKALNILEATATLQGQALKAITKKILQDTLQSPYLRYDQGGDEHYNTISAFIKSMRASQTDAALYYLARMIVAGEDPVFIARRMVIFASEDIGVAVPTALVVANAVFAAVQTIGYPECGINMAHGVVYLCQCKKSRSANDGLIAAMADVKQYGNLDIPLKIRNAPTGLMKDQGYGAGYNMRDTESYLPDKLKNKKYFS